MSDRSEKNALAKEVADLLSKDDSLTVDELAEKTGSDHPTIVEVLDEYMVTDGKVEHAGEGQGGGWVQAE